MPPRISPQSGFSLAESLIVLVVVSLLVVLLLPAIQQAAETSRMARCAQKLRQLGADVLLTFQENNGALAWYEAPRQTHGMWWYKVHVRDDFANFNQRMSCPSLSKVYEFRYSPQQRSLHGNYRYNKYMGYQEKTAGTWVYPLRRLASMRQPGRIALLADFVSPLADRADDSSGFESWNFTTIAHRNRHVGQVLCLDGHIELITANQPHSLVLNPRALD